MQGGDRLKKVPVRIIDTSFNLLGEIDDYESLQFTRRFFRAGEFEMHISIGKEGVAELQQDRIIVLGKQAHKAGIIKHIEIALDESGIEKLVVRGQTLGGLLDRRITIADDYDRVRGTAETVIKHYVTNHLIDSPYAARNVPFLICAPDQQRGMTTPWQARYEPLDSVVEEIAKWCDIGWFIRLDFALKKWVLDVLVGRNLTVSQSTLPPVIFSTDFDNVQSQQFIDNTDAWKNVGYAGGKGEEEMRLIQVVGEAAGFDRREVFIDASSAEDVIELASMGEQKLSESKRLTTFGGRVLDTNSFIYERDWDLGDIITLQNRKWRVTMDTRIIEVKEIFEQAPKVEVTFGEDLPTVKGILNGLKNQVKRSG